MKFDLFLNNVPKMQQADLPATVSHLKMAPMERAKMMELWDYSKLNPKKAGVLALFYPKKTETYLVLIVRTPKGLHASQVALPGGKFEEQDKDLSHTAIRETEEEIGVYQDKINLVTNLSEIYVPPSNFLVYPFIGHLDFEPKFTLQQDEVSQIIEIPLNDFLNVKTTNHNIKASYSSFSGVPAYIIDSKVVWGATAMILSELKDVLQQSLKDRFNY